MRFGVHIPTCIEGMMYPVPFARPEDVLPTALLCERLGFDSVWGNDHMTTQRYVQREWPEPPNFYEPLVTFTWVAARTDETLLANLAPLEQRIGRDIHRRTVELLEVDERQSGVRELVQATLDLVRGLGLANTISDDAARRRRILDQWARTLDSQISRPETAEETP